MINGKYFYGKLFSRLTKYISTELQTLWESCKDHVQNTLKKIKRWKSWNQPVRGLLSMLFTGFFLFHYIRFIVTNFHELFTNFKSTEKFDTIFYYLFSHQVQTTIYLMDNNLLSWILRNLLPANFMKKIAKKTYQKKFYINYILIKHNMRKINWRCARFPVKISFVENF